MSAPPTLLSSMNDSAATTEPLEPALATGAAAALSAEGGLAGAPSTSRDSSPSVDEDERVVPDPGAAGSRLPLQGAALLLTLASLFGPLSASGIWEPHELKVAELSRRIAVNLLGAGKLALSGSTNTVPTASELGRGELPFTSIALGFKLFGLSEWAGRLPMALWGLLGVVATYVLLARLVDRVAGAFAAIVLATTPLYFLQSRTMLGDIVALSGLAVGTAGFALAAFDPRPTAIRRLAFFGFGVAGSAAAFGTRGVLVGIVPAAAIGVAWLLRGLSGAGKSDRLGSVFGVLCLALAVAGAYLAFRALAGIEEKPFSRLLGATLVHRHPTPTFDAIVLELGHALFPWSAVVPFALGRILRAPPSVSGDAFDRETSARLVVATASILGFAAYGVLAPAVGVLPYGPVFALAAAVAILFRDFERGAPASRTLALCVAAFLILFLTDFQNFPEKGLSGFVIDDARFPDSFKERATHILELGTLASAGLFALGFFERAEGQRPFVAEDYRAWPRTFRRALDGNLVFGAIALEIGLVAYGVLLYVSDKYTHWQQFQGLAAPVRDLAHYGFALVPAALVSPSLALVGRDLCRLAVQKLRVTRAVVSLAALAGFGAVLGFAYYPALAKQISPKEVFESFQKFAGPGEELAMIGGGTGGARYYARRDVTTFGTVQEGFSWLTEHDQPRRWLVVRAADIAQINSLYRARRTPAKNIPVLDARSSEIMLVSNQLRPGETNQNPFAKWVLDERPSPTRRVDADFNGQLHAFGWDVTTPDGEPVTWVTAGKPYVFRFYYEVTRAIAGDWQTFIHVDGYQRRYNGDHDTLEGKYPFHLWHPGDFIVDIHPFELEPNFTAGQYTVYFGLFRGDQRLDVTRGGGDDDRVNAGILDVR
jgi:4-amino-4-deoxy-L-arabinose transferase-like glycosyltransferase